MFLIRQSKPKDSGTLAKLARMVYFISLPPNEQIITDKTLHSARSFAKAAGAAPESRPSRSRKAVGIVGLAVQDADLFMFTMEDLDSGGVIGTSQVKAHMGGNQVIGLRSSATSARAGRAMPFSGAIAALASHMTHACV